MADESGLNALDHARRKLACLQSRPRRCVKSPALDENNQLRLSADEQEELDELRREVSGEDREYLRMWWQERLRAARRVFNDPEQVEKIVEILQSVGAQE